MRYFKPALAAVALVALAVPAIALAQTTTTPAKPMVIQGVITNVDTSCANSAPSPKGCQAIVDVDPNAQAPASATPSSGTSSSSTSTSSTSTSGATNATQPTKITIPKNLKVQQQGGEKTVSPTPSTTTILKKGNVVRISYDQMSNGNVATSVVILQ